MPDVPTTPPDTAQAIAAGAAGGWPVPGTAAPTLMYSMTYMGDPGVHAANAIDERSAAEIPTFWAAVRWLCETLAGFPKHVLASPTPLTRERRHDDPLDPILNDEASDLQTALQLFETWIFHGVVWGNGYAYIERDGPAVTALYNLMPDRVQPFSAGGKRWYGVDVGGAAGEPASRWVPVPADQILHLAGLGFDGFRGYPVVQLMRQSLGIGKAAETYGLNYFHNGGNVGLSLETDQTLTPEQIADLKQQINANHTGLQNAHKAMVLQRGMTAKTLTPANDAAQFLQTRQFSVLDVCRALRVEPFVVYDLSRATWNNLQLQNTTAVQYSLMPWINRMEAELNRKLIPAIGRRAGLHVRFDVSSLERGDLTQRIDNATKRLASGITSINEERTQMGLPPIGAEGDVYRVALNQGPAATAQQPPPPADPTEQTNGN